MTTTSRARIRWTPHKMETDGHAYTICILVDTLVLPNYIVTKQHRPALEGRITSGYARGALLIGPFDPLLQFTQIVFSVT